MPVLAGAVSASTSASARCGAASCGAQTSRGAYSSSWAWAMAGGCCASHPTSTPMSLVSSDDQRMFTYSKVFVFHAGIIFEFLLSNFLKRCVFNW